MCGIVGVVSKEQASDILVAGLKQLEYRGYDSVGLSVFENGSIKTVKTQGRIANLVKKLEKSPLNGGVGIGHTRWATHGEPSDINSHPHGNHRVSLVHNGIIENYLFIKARMIRKGYTFESETDTEALAKLLDYYYVQKGTPLEAIKKVLEKIRGSFAVGMIFDGHPNTIYAIRKDSPLIVGLGKGKNFIASDITAILDYTRDYYLLEEGEIAVVQQDKVTILDNDLEVVQKDVQTASWDRQSAEKEGYPHFMLKEIHDQPKVLMNAINPRLKNNTIDFTDEGLSDKFLSSITKFHMVACGTAMHAAMIGKHMIEAQARIPVDVHIASEFRYGDPILKASEVVMVISQSGETADTLAALRLAKANGLKVIAVVNVVGSSIAREADVVLYTWAGLEIAVASTKAYFVQSALLTLLAMKLKRLHNLCDDAEITSFVSELHTIPNMVSAILNEQEHIKQLASLIVSKPSLFFIGRSLDYSLALEASLKLKEISYIHSEAYAAGELKHGTISLITDNVPVVAIATQEKLYEKIISNIKEVKARGAKVFLFALDDPMFETEVADHRFILPKVQPALIPLIAIIPLQLFAYYASVLKGLDVDKPRNLAKSVTVE